MNENKCNECGKGLEIGSWVVGDNDNQTFCHGEHSPLEDNSCARKYIERTRDFSKSYFFIKLEGK